MKLEFDGAVAFLKADDGSLVADTFAVYFSPVKKAPIAEYIDGNGLRVYADVSLRGATKASEPKAAKAEPKAIAVEPEAATAPAVAARPIK